MKNTSYVKVLVVLATCLLFVGCLSKSVPPRVFVLSSTAEAKDGNPVQESKIVVGGVKVDMPSYLRRYDFVERFKGGELVFRADHQWAVIFDLGVKNILTENLEKLTFAPKAENETAKFFKVSVDFKECEVLNYGEKRELRMSGRYSLLRDDEAAGNYTFVFSMNVTEDPLNIVAAYNKMLLELSQKIAQNMN